VLREKKKTGKSKSHYFLGRRGQGSRTLKRSLMGREKIAYLLGGLTLSKTRMERLIPEGRRNRLLSITARKGLGGESNTIGTTSEKNSERGATGKKWQACARHYTRAEEARLTEGDRGARPILVPGKFARERQSKKAQKEVKRERTGNLISRQRIVKMNGDA